MEYTLCGYGCEAGAVLEISGISKSFGGFRAVSDVSLTVETRQIAAVIGPNGAGKSTLFNLITGHLPPDSGTVRLDGRDITGAPPYRICRMGIGRSFQRTNIFTKLTVFENLQAAYLVHHRRGVNFWGRSDAFYRDETTALLNSIGLAGQENTIAGTLSYGNQKQLELGLALASDPQILLLDEPTAGMSATETHETIQLLERIAAERELTLLFTEHDMEVVFSIAQKIARAASGKGDRRRLSRKLSVLTPRCAACISDTGWCTSDDRAAQCRGYSFRLRPQPGAVRHFARGHGGRVCLPAGAQWRRQDDDDPFGDGPDAADAADGSCGRAPISPAGRRTGSRVPASALFPKTAASSPN